MRKTPDNLNIPCHRVISKSGILAPDYAFGGKEIQRALLESEGITFEQDGRVKLLKHLWDGKET
ncbi:methylated-DNA--protein-cysteine methyltransferase [Desulfocucumis palustris]|uniref:Methylated-DNA--protein-cysteine methyltransferase n=2 Tax=Desulfocucumis palustris TaxID=1898651 RepID=A0A2L2X8Y0_9FIRM|nr:methylated-DNA--protein-cysteine methyltransferase [Desulfocucumis palustris]